MLLPIGEDRQRCEGINNDQLFSSHDESAAMGGRDNYASELHHKTKIVVDRMKTRVVLSKAKNTGGKTSESLTVEHHISD